MVPDVAVTLDYVVPDEATTNAKYPALQVIEVIVVYVVPVIAQDAMFAYPTIVVDPSPYFKLVEVHAAQEFAEAK